jgi:hypothetical protein
MTLFGCIECCLHILPPNSEIFLTLSQANSGFVVSFACRADAEHVLPLLQDLSTGEIWLQLQAMAASIGGAIEMDDINLCIHLLLADNSA